MLRVPESRPQARMAARWQPKCLVLVRCAPRPHLKSAALLAEAQVLPIDRHARRLEMVTADLQSSKRGRAGRTSAREASPASVAATPAAAAGAAGPAPRPRTASHARGTSAGEVQRGGRGSRE